MTKISRIYIPRETKELPDVTVDDNNKLLGVKDGIWQALSPIDALVPDYYNMIAYTDYPKVKDGSVTLTIPGGHKLGWYLFRCNSVAKQSWHLSWSVKKPNESNSIVVARIGIGNDGGYRHMTMFPIYKGLNIILKNHQGADKPFANNSASHFFVPPLDTRTL